MFALHGHLSQIFMCVYVSALRVCPQSRRPYPFTQVAGEDEVSGEGVGEGRVKLQHLKQGFPLDDVEVAVR